MQLDFYSVKIIGDLVVSGGDEINVWRLSDVMKGITRPTYRRETHHHYITKLASSRSDYVVSSGPLRVNLSDSTVQFWRVGSHSMQESRKPIILNNSKVFSIDMKDHTVAAGTLQKVEQTAISIVSSIFSVFLAGSVSDG